MMDFMICLLDSVCIGQLTKKNRSEWFVCRVSGSGESGNARFSAESSDSAPSSFSFPNESRLSNGANGHQSTQH